MKRSEIILKISEKLQKQMHMINSEKTRNQPKMLCDNLALRVLTVIEEAGMIPPQQRIDVINDRIVELFVHDSIESKNLITENIDDDYVIKDVRILWEPEEN